MDRTSLRRRAPCFVGIAAMVVVLIGCGTDVGGSSSPPTRVPGIAGLDGAAMLARLEDRGGYVCSGPEPVASTLQRWTCISEPADPTVAPRVEVIIRGESLQAVDSLDVSIDLARVMASYGIAHMTLTYIVDATALPDDLRRAAREFLDTHGFEEGQADLPGLTMYLTGGQALRRLELVRNDLDEATVPFGK